MDEETLKMWRLPMEERVHWFRTLSMERRLEIVLEMSEMAIAADPSIVERHIEEHVRRGAKVIRLP
ncbi:MAG: hypothetical protein ABFD92_03120 [Planctomycetaceae bacterium]